MDSLETKDATAQFSELLIQEKKRETDLANHKSPQVKTNTIGLLPGDGIGPRLMTQAKRVLNQLLQSEIAAGNFKMEEISGCTLNDRLKAGQAVPKDVLEKIKTYPVLLKGPMATPKAGETSKNLESANAKLRRSLDLYAAMRPMQLDNGREWTFFRENIEGPYLFGSKGVQVDDELSVDFVVLTQTEITRLAKRAFEYAKNHGKTDVAVVTKANIVKLTDGNFLKTCQEIGKGYPGITVTPYFVDAMAANLHNPEFGNQLQVVILPNLYGDIITDIAAQLQGGLGSAGSANIGDDYAIFEAIHGTAPWLFEHHLEDYADPRSLLRAVAMLLDHIGYAEQSQRLTDGLNGLSTNADLPNADNHVTTANYVTTLLERL